MEHFSSLMLLLAILLAGCSPSASSPATVPESRTLTVFAAASLTDAFTEIGGNFEMANPDVSITFNFGGSQALRTQIEEGALVDVFASANANEMDALIAGGFITEGAYQFFLSNTLVVILPGDNPADLKSLEDLANPGVKIVLAAEEVPVGGYTRRSLDLMNGSFGADFKDRVMENVVSNEGNVKQVVAKVQLGEVDAGIVYASDAAAAPELQKMEIPVQLNVFAKYPIASLLESANADLAQAFIAYVLSADGQAVLQKWGFAPAR